MLDCAASAVSATSYLSQLCVYFHDGATPRIVLVDIYLFGAHAVLHILQNKICYVLYA